MNRSSIYKNLQNTKDNVQPVDNTSMTEKERRKYPRIDSSNLIACYCLDEAGNEVSHLMARAVDVSPVGVGLETFQDINSDRVRLMSTETTDTLIDIEGRVVHSRQIEDGRYHVGISFAGTETENTRYALKLINDCHQVRPELVMYKGARSNKKTRRQYPRLEASNLLFYTCLDEDNNEMAQFIAKAVDVNPLGAKIEAYQEILSDNIQLSAIDRDDNLIEITGTVVHTHKSEDGSYELGISFTGTMAERINFALRLIDFCHNVEPGFIMAKKA